MPVIGRLDDQVDRLLISPIGKRDEPADATRAEAQRPSRDEERAAAERRKRVERPAHYAEEPELPVWLL